MCKPHDAYVTVRPNAKGSYYVAYMVCHNGADEVYHMEKQFNTTKEKAEELAVKWAALLKCEIR